MRGSVVKRGKKYSIILGLGLDPVTKKRKQKWISGFTKKPEAQKELTRLVNEYNRGVFIEPDKSTLEAYLEKWLEIHKSSVSERTYNRYSEQVYNHIIPLLGVLELSKIKPMHIQQFLSIMQTRDKHGDRKGTLSPTTINHAHGVLRKALNDAVKWQMTQTNPAIATTPPKNKQIKATPNAAKRMGSDCRARKMAKRNRNRAW